MTGFDCKLILALEPILLFQMQHYLESQHKKQVKVTNGLHCYWNLHCLTSMSHSLLFLEGPLWHSRFWEK